jgi:hypothetical protein
MPATGSAHYPYSEKIYNQSLAGAANRWFTTTLAWSEQGLTIANSDDGSGSGAMKAVLHGCQLALLMIGIGLCVRRPTGTRNEVWEYGLILALMLLLSPMSSKPHFCTLLLPGFLLARAAVEERDRVSGVLLVIAILAGALGTRGLVGRDWSTAALWGGNVMWVTVAVLVGCGWRLYRENQLPRPAVKRTYPLMTPTGRMRATFRDNPARSTTSTTSSTFL